MAASAGAETHVVEVENARGHAGNPLSDREVEAKFRSLAADVLPDGRVRGLLSRLWGFEREPRVSSFTADLAL